MIVSGTSDRHVRAIAESIEEELRKVSLKPTRREGERELRWVLLDYPEIVVHVFLEEDRAFYELERLWRDAPQVAWEQDREPADADRRSARS